MKNTKRLIAIVLTMIIVGGMLPLSLVLGNAAGATLREVSFPRGAEQNYPTNNHNYFWGNYKLNYLNGWGSIASRNKHTGETNIAAIFTIDGYTQVGYCVEPSTQIAGDGASAGNETSTENGTLDWNSIANGTGGTLNAAQVEKYLSLILYYGYNGNSYVPDWHSTNDKYQLFAKTLATQLLVWETVVGERDSNFNNRFDLGDPATAGYNRVKEHVTDKHPLRSMIFDNYNQIVEKVKADVVGPSFTYLSKAEAEEEDNLNKIEYNSGKFTVTLTDTLGTIGEFSISDFTIPEGLSCRISGNNLIVEADRPFIGCKTIKLTKRYNTPSASLYTDGVHQPGVGNQDLITCNAQRLTPHTRDYYVSFECPHHHVFIPHKIMPTCVDEGYTIWKCACGVVTSKNPVTEEDSLVPAQGHDNVNAQWITVIPLTCQEDGEDALLCGRCGVVINTRTKAHSGHDSGVWKVDIEATPNRDGQKTRYCTKCGEALETQTFTYHTHTLGHTEIVRQPSCTENGLNGNFCGICNACYETFEIEKTGHSSEEESKWVTTTAPTCTTDGEKTGYCANCGEKTATQKIDKLGHKDGEWITNVYATCSNEGEEICVCDACGEITDSRPIAALAHDEGTWNVTAAATCLTDGEKTLKCTRCGETIESQVIPAEGHDEGVWRIDFDATPERDGQKSRYCSKCGAVLESQTFKTHDHKEGYREVVIEPTCTDDGEEGIFCAVCGEKYDTNPIAALGHDEGVWVVTANASCQNDGEKVLKCTRCDKVIDSKAIPAEGHDDGVWRIDFEPTPERNGQKSRYCSKCDAILERVPIVFHNHVEGYRKVILEPTCTDDGEEAIFCSICGAKFDTAPVKAPGHDWSEIAMNNDSTHSKTCSRCHYVYTESCTFESGKTAAACVTPGYTKRTCTQCGYTYQDSFAESLGHNWSKWTDDKNGATHTRTCSRCHLTEIDTHVWSEWRIIEKNTLNRTTTYERKCEICGAIQQANKDFEIQHTLVKVEATPNTCTEDGNKEYYYCTAEGCGKYYSDENGENEIEKDSWIIPAHGHNYILKDTVPNTCTEDGYEYYECTWDASHNYKEPIPAHGHDYQLIPEKCVEPTIDVPGYNYYECSYDPNHNYVKTVYKVGDTDSNKSAINNSDGTTTITLKASSDGEQIYVSEPKPVDVVLLLDTSGSMKQDSNGISPGNKGYNGPSKMEGLKETAKTFVSSVAKNPDNRIAVVSFASDGVFYKNNGESYTLYQSNLDRNNKPHDSDNLQTTDCSGAMMSASEDEDVIKNIIDGLVADGATRADFAFKTSEQIIAQNKFDNRKTVIVFITDGEPGITGFNADTANASIYSSYELKQDNVKVYSVGLNTTNNDSMTSFMNFVSSNYPDAESMTKSGARASDEYYVYAANAGDLDEIFETVVTTEIRPLKPFEDITIFDTISKEFTMTAVQEQAFRESVINEYGIKNDDITVVVNSDGTTSVTVRHLNPKTRTDAAGNIEFYVEISFDITANEKAAGSEYYNTNTEAAGYMVGGMLVNSFESPRVTVPDDRNIVVFLLGDKAGGYRVYTITEANIGDEIAVPVTEYATWDVPDGFTVSKPYEEFTATYTSELKTVKWRLADKTVELKYHVGEPIPVYNVDNKDGPKFLGWDKPIPYAMPDSNLEFTALYEEHTHNWSKDPVTQFGSCEDGITYVYACECGEIYTAKSAPCDHEYTATINNLDGLNYAIITCEKCHFIQEKYMTFKTEYSAEDYESGNFNSSDQFIDLKLYDANDVSIQPDGKMSIVIPASSQMIHDENLRIYRINEDGTKEEIEFTKDDGRDVIIMEVDHFSYYVITASNAVEASTTYDKVDCGLTTGHNYVMDIIRPSTCTQEGSKGYICSHCGKSYGEESIPASDHSDNNNDGKCDECNEEICNHICHSQKWYKKIFWFFIKMFYRIFGINKYCDCGKAHY